MTLGEQQKLFVRLVHKLLAYGWDLGWEFTFGESFRSDEQAEINSLGQDGREKLAVLIQGQYPDLALKVRNNGKNNGIRLSIHQDKLAVDLNLFHRVSGAYLGETEDHELLGAYWESLHPLCRWGGKFRDGNHYSMEFMGRK